MRKIIYRVKKLPKTWLFKKSNAVIVQVQKPERVFAHPLKRGHGIALSLSSIRNCECFLSAQLPSHHFTHSNWTSFLPDTVKVTFLFAPAASNTSRCDHCASILMLHLLYSDENCDLKGESGPRGRKRKKKPERFKPVINDVMLHMSDC